MRTPKPAGNFIDTADVYNKWVPGHVGGDSETLIGQWRKARSAQGTIVATKIGMGGPGLEPGLSAEQVRRGAEGCLERLGVEQIDLLYAHRDDEKTRLEETLAAFDALVRAGKVRAIGASNYSPERLQAALDVSKQHGFASYTVVQPEYNLVSRGVLEGALADVCMKNDLAVCTYYALASGFLTDKYQPGEKANGARAGAVGKFLNSDAAVATLAALRSVAKKHGATAAQIALAWQLHKPFVTAPIASATSARQVRELVKCIDIALDAHDMQALES